MIEIDETDMHNHIIPFSSGCRSNNSSIAPKKKKRTNTEKLKVTKEDLQYTDNQYVNI